MKNYNFMIVRKLDLMVENWRFSFKSIIRRDYHEPQCGRKYGVVEQYVIVAYARVQFVTRDLALACIRGDYRGRRTKVISVCFRLLERLCVPGFWHLLKPRAYISKALSHGGESHENLIADHYAVHYICHFRWLGNVALRIKMHCLCKFQSCPAVSSLRTNIIVMINKIPHLHEKCTLY